LRLSELSADGEEFTLNCGVEKLLSQVFRHEVSGLLIDFCHAGRNLFTTQAVARSFHSQELGGCFHFPGCFKNEL
jgi:hypothetical protein